MKAVSRLYFTSSTKANVVNVFSEKENSVSVTEIFGSMSTYLYLRFDKIIYKCWSDLKCVF